MIIRIFAAFVKCAPAGMENFQDFLYKISLSSYNERGAKWLCARFAETDAQED